MLTPCEMLAAGVLRTLRTSPVEPHNSRAAARRSAPEHRVTVQLQRLSAQKRERLAQLMDKNSERGLSQAEQAELQRLGREVDQMLLANSAALARAVRPELFDTRGRRVQSRFRQARECRGRNIVRHPRRSPPLRTNRRAASGPVHWRYATGSCGTRRW
jgi:hypothetical protein